MRQRKFFLVVLLTLSIFGVAEFVFGFDHDIRSFVKAYQFPDPKPIKIIYEDRNYNFSYFRIQYGPGMDCMAGCHYAFAYGIKFNDKIGWILTQYALGYESKLSSDVYSLSDDEIVLFSPEFMESIFSKDSFSADDNFFKFLFTNFQFSDKQLLELLENLEEKTPRLNHCDWLWNNPTISSNPEMVQILRDHPNACYSWVSKSD